MLTERKRRFALAYIESPNATEAAIKAGYSLRTAKQQGSRLLTDVDVSSFLAPRQKKLEERQELSTERLDEETIRCAHYDLAEAYDEEGNVLPIHKIPPDVRRAIDGYEREPIWEDVVVGVGPRGGAVRERRLVGYRTKITWARRADFITLGYKRRGALVEKHELQVPARVSIKIGVRGVREVPEVARRVDALGAVVEEITGTVPGKAPARGR